MAAYLVSLLKAWSLVPSDEDASEFLNIFNCMVRSAQEKGHGPTRDLHHESPADWLVTGWDRGIPAAMDITVTSPLTPVILGGSCQVVGAAALNRKKQTNSPKMSGARVGLYTLGSRNL